VIKRREILPLIVITALLIGFGAGWLISRDRCADSMERIIAVKWGDGRYGKAFYGAYVLLEPSGDGYLVRSRVYLGRGNDYYHDCGVIGTVSNDAEAVSRWGTIDWKDDGLHIGSYFLPRDRLENHR
jgi:hypothetical protein